ncbi:MAG: hypothetical protein EXR92_07785 [Gemmatimonadetes bacterium]|nr:hypothetical protein [Gemmatimonadota bacterium]
MKLLPKLPRSCDGTLTTAARSFRTRCPSCSTRFPVDPRKVPEDGVAAICSACMRVFTVVLPEGYVGLSSRVQPALPPATTAPQPEGSEAPSERATEAEPRSTNPQSMGPSVEPFAGLATLDVDPEPAAPPANFRIDPEPVLTEPVAEARAPEIDALDEVASKAPPAVDSVELEPLVPGLREAPLSAAAFGVVEDPPMVALPPAPSKPEPNQPPPAKAPPARKDTYVDLSRFANDALADSTPEPPGARASKSPTAGSERFGKRYPRERARHLARVLVSDIIAYYPVRYQEALSRETLPKDFENEIKKSMREYVDQVGAEMAESTPYFTEALNEVLARGKKVF